MKKLNTLFLFLHCVYILNAQNIAPEYSVVREDLDNMFENIDKTKIPTGFLLDYAVDLVEFPDYDGTELSESNFVDISTYRDILLSIYSSAVNEKPFGNVDMMLKAFQFHNSNIEISMAAFSYNYIKENALTDNLIQYNESNEQVFDVYIDNEWQNPYSSKTIFAFTPNLSSIPHLFAPFKFTLAHKYTNLEISSIFFDADDNKGYRTVRFPMAVNVIYSTPVM